MPTLSDRKNSRKIIVFGLTLAFVSIGFSAQAMKLAERQVTGFDDASIVRIAVNPSMKFQMDISRARLQNQKLKAISRRIKRVNSTLKRSVAKLK